MKRASSLTITSFAVSGIPSGAIRNGIVWFLLFFYSQVIGLSAGLAGLALGIALVVDAVTDPWIGHISDGWQSRWGRRHHFRYTSEVTHEGEVVWNFWNQEGKT